MLKNISLSVVAVSLIFVVGEVVCRAFCRPSMKVVPKLLREADGPRSNLQVSGMPDRLYQYTATGGVRLTPNANILLENHYLSHQDIEITTNSFGFRAPELKSDKGSEFRILALGDSITLGDYVPYEDTYTSRLEHYLGPHIKVINAGIGSADIRNEYHILVEAGLTMKPDVVLLGMYFNDGEISPSFVIQPLPGIIGKSSFINFIYQRAKIIAYRIKHRTELSDRGALWAGEFTNNRNADKDADWMTNKAGFNYLIVKNARDWGAGWNPKTWETLKTWTERFKILEKEHNFKLAVILFPVRYQVEADYVYDAPQRYFKQVMEELRVPHLDLLPALRLAFAKHAVDGLYYDACHYKPVGNDIVAKATGDFLVREGLVK